MPDVWEQHVIDQMDLAERDAARLLEITTQIIYWEGIDLIPEGTADNLLTHMRQLNNKLDPANRFKFS